MLAPLVITFREGLEAALIVAVVLAYVRQVQAAGAARRVWLGVAAAIAASAAVGGLLVLTGGELTGSSEALFEAGVMLAAVAVLTATIIWMQRQAATQGVRLQRDVDAALAVGGGALFWLAFLGVAREGVETSLFLMTAPGETGPVAVVAGGLAGLGLAAAVGYAVYRGGRRLPLRAFFTATNVVLVGFAVYLVWRAVAELGEIVGGEAFELLGPAAAAVYGVLLVLGLRRVRRSSAPGSATTIATAQERRAA
jgi:high-affinity iron transporter